MTRADRAGLPQQPLPRWPGAIITAAGLAHLLLGLAHFPDELRRLPQPLDDASLWFLVTGGSLVLLGTDIAARPDAVAAPARRIRGLGLAVVAALILTQRPRSGAWALLGVGAVMATGSGSRPIRPAQARPT